MLGPAAYAYRPGLGVADAVQAVVGLRAEGLTWVLRTDVDDCFPSTPVALARRRFGALVDDPELLRVVDLLLARMGIAAGRGRRVVRGLAQGCALSPLLSNLVLVDVDSALLREGFSVVRYADDILVAAETQSDAWEAARCASRACEELGMELGADKTAVLSFADGFAFLGEEFGPRYPPLVPDFRVGEPERRTLYAATQGGRVRIQSGRLIVEDAEDAEQLDVPSGLVGRIVCFGSVGLSAGARSWALSNDVDIVFASRRGTYLGSFVGAGTTRAARLRSQLAVTGTDQALRIGRAIVEAKIRKQIVVLQRFGRREHAELVTDAIRRAEHSLLMLPDCRTVDEVMGMEGAAAAAYFPAYGGLCPRACASRPAADSRPWMSRTPRCRSSTRSCSASASPPCMPRAWTRIWACCTPTTRSGPVLRWTWSRSSDRWSSTRSCSRRLGRGGSRRHTGGGKKDAPG